MKSLPGTGKLTIPVMLSVNANNKPSWLSGNTHNINKMFERVKLGYNRKFTDYVMEYGIMEC